MHTLSPTGSNHGSIDPANHLNHLASEARKSDVAERGADVMPFNVHDTHHYFVKNAKGGTQQVLAKGKHDVDQIQFVRLHLKEIREQFLQNDFSGPAHIHGNNMPGLQELQAAESGEIDIHYSEVESGAELIYVAKNEKLVTAIHKWFDAQVSDHGNDASYRHPESSEGTRI